MREILCVSLLVAGVSLGGCASGEGGVAVAEGELRTDCSLVRCAMPLCSEGQHLQTGGNDCCPSCVGPEPRCAAVLCPMYRCAMGYHLEQRGNQCCASCVQDHPTAECDVDADCPSFQCFACPCPTSSCQGHQCRTSTPDASSCGI